MLLTAGCSFVWGDELDGYDNNPPTHWEHTFTDILSKKMGVDYVNLGRCGAGNEQIFRKVTDYLHQDKENTVTHMVILWSAWQRKELVEYQPPERNVKIARDLDTSQFSSLRTNNINTKNVRKIFDQWFETCYDSRTDIMNTLTKMKSIEIICEERGIKLIQGSFHRRNYSNIMAVLTDGAEDNQTDLPDYLKIDKVPEYKKWLIESLGALKKTSRVGMGNSGIMKDLYTIGQQINDIKEFGHPGEKSNQKYANLLFENFTKIENGVL